VCVCACTFVRAWVCAWICVHECVCACTRMWVGGCAVNVFLRAIQCVVAASNVRTNAQLCASGTDRNAPHSFARRDLGIHRQSKALHFGARWLVTANTAYRISGVLYCGLEGASCLPAVLLVRIPGSCAPHAPAGGSESCLRLMQAATC